MKRKFLAWLLTIAMVFNMALPYAAFADELPIDTDTSYSADEFGATNNDDDATDVEGEPTVGEPSTDDEPAAGEPSDEEPAVDPVDGNEHNAESDGKEVGEPAGEPQGDTPVLGDVSNVGTFATPQGGVAAVADTENHAPTKVQEDYSKYLKLEFSFAQSLTSYFKDDDGDTLTYYYQIKLGDETKVDWTETTATVSYKPEAAGVYKVYCKANDGQADSEILTITLTVVENTAPTVKADAVTKVDVLSGIPFDLKMEDIFEDIDVTNQCDNLSYTVYVDKSTTGTYVRTSTNGYVYTGTFYTAGDHKLKFVAKDNTDGQVEHTVAVNVSTDKLDADVWNGCVDTRWYNTTDTEFTLNKPAELAALAYIVNGKLVDEGIAKDSFEGKTIKLGADMKLNDAEFTYHRDVNRVEITQGDVTVYYAPNYVSGTGNGAPENVGKTFYSTKSGTTAKTDTGLNLNGWVAIGDGSEATSFKGTFDGQNHKISGLYHNDYNLQKGDVYIGLFGSLNGTVENLTLDGLFVSAYNASVFAGGVAAQVYGGKIANCTNNVMLLGGSANSNASYFGGILGRLSANAAFEGRDLVNNAPVQVMGNVGGIAAMVAGGTGGRWQPHNNVDLINCVNNGAIDYVGSKTGTYVAGIAASVMSNYVTIDRAVNTGAIGTLQEKKNGDAHGGIVGWLLMSNKLCTSADNTTKVYGSFELTNSYNVGEIHGSTISAGLIGNAGFAKASAKENTVIKNCYSAGKLTCGAKLTANYGGIIGTGTVYDAYIENLYYTNESYADITSTSVKTLDGLQAVSAAELQAADFVTKLGEEFVPDKNNKNDGYPILATEDMGSSAKEITAFTLNGVDATIDNDTKTITFSTPFDMVVNGSTCELTPVVTVSDKATVKPSGAATFKQSADDNTKYTCEYLVTAENGTVRAYTVVVSTAATVSGVTLDKTSINLIAGFGTETIKAIIAPANATNIAVTWTSSDDNIATVDANGVVTGVAEGTATITATTADGGKTATCAVKVAPFVSVTGVTLPETASVIRNDEITLTAIIAPENASNKAITWESKDSTIATVDENGKVKGIKEGTVEITVTTADGAKVATCAVTVKKIDVTKVELTKTTYLAVGAKKMIQSTVLPANATELGLQWESSATGVATVDENGVVKGVSAGEVTITATSKDNAAICDTVTLQVVDEYPYDIGWSGTFNANSNNNNIVPGKLIRDDQIAVEEWNASVDNSTVAVVGDYVYTYACAYGMDGFQMGGERQTFYKIDKATGEIVDTITDCPGSGGYYYGYTIYGDGMIYVACPGTVMAFDIDSFTMVWATKVGNNNYVPIQYISGTEDYVVSNGCVLNAVTGALVKNLDGKYNYSSGAVVGNNFIVAGCDGYLHSFDTTTWTEKEKVQFAPEYVTNANVQIVSQGGVLYHNGYVYWVGINQPTETSYMYYLAVKSDGSFDGSLGKIEVSKMNVVTPVAYGNRIYLAGQGDSATSSNNGIWVYDATTKELIYKTSVHMGKIQSTPLIYADTENNAVYVYVQTYEGSHIYYLKDTPDATSGSLKWLATPSLRQYAFEQLSCDKDGALYVTNDSGHLFKLIGVNGKHPEITVDLSDEPVTYTKGATAKALTITATIDEADATLKYQWQSSENDVDSEYADIEGATGNSYTPDVSKTGTTFYRCKVINSKDERVYIMSTAAQIRVEETGSTGGGTVTPSEKTVPVTINFSMDGELVVHNASLNVRDTDGDKKFTMHDAFTVLHEKYNRADDYEGASDGWVTKFWGDTSHNFGYTQNHKWVWGANQVINSGDKLDVFIYQDTSQDYSDLLTWFAKDSYSGKTGNKITFVVNGMYLFGSGETNKQALAVPQGATVTISKDGDEIATTTTDENGKFELSFPDAGLYTIDVTGTCSFTVNGAYASGSYTDAPVVPCRCTVSISGTSTGGGIGGATTSETKYIASDVIDLIDAIGTVTKDSKSAIEKARAAYDSLTEAQQKKVTNYDKLTAAEAKYTELTGEKIEVITGDLPFTDVKSGAWYYDAIKAMYYKGLMNGESTTQFMPNNKLSRAMLVTILYRLAEQPEVTATTNFDDVAADQWYTKAVAWASGNNIVSGVGDGKFAPNDNVTRQELAAMLYRYASATGLNITATANLSSFSDSNSVATWAETAMQWAVGCGLIKGDETGALNPTGTATRAEVATVIVRLIEMSAK